MNSEFVRVAFLIGLSAALVTIWILWRLTSRLSAWARWSSRLLSLPVSGALGVTVFALLFVPRDEGTWLCLVCGKQRDELRWAGVTVTVSNASRVRANDSFVVPYEEWYREQIGEEHSHTWLPIGAHRVALAAVACSLIQGLPHIQYLPDLPDDQLAVRVVRRFLETPDRDRARLQRDLLRVARDHRDQTHSSLDSAESFVPVFETWLAEGGSSGLAER